MTPVRIGILGGAGEAAQGHIEGFQQTAPRAEVVALWDVDQDRARRRADAMGVPDVAGTAEELLARDDIDAVVICTPDHLHAAHAKAALLAGKHVLVEKPTSTTREDAAELVRLVAQTGRVFLGGHVYHFRPDYRAVVDTYHRGEIGRAWLAEGDYVSDLSDLYGPTGRTPWRSDSTHPQDILLGGGCHPLGLIRWALRDEVVEVTAYSNHMVEQTLPIDDCYVMLLRFSQGTIGRITAAAGNRARVPDGGHIVLRGTTGSLWESRLYRDDERRGHGAPPLVEKDFGALCRASNPTAADPAVAHDWTAQAEHFLDCVEGRSEPMTSVLDSARVVAALAAGVESARTGRPVRVDNDFGV